MTERKDPWNFVDLADDPRNTGHQPVGEREVLLDYLDHFRMTLELKCQGLDVEQLAQQSVPPSNLSLLGLVRHLAKVEHHWFRRVMERQGDLPRLYRTDAEPDLDFTGAVGEQACVDDAWASWRREVAHAREYVAGVADLDVEGSHGEEPIALREVLVHLIEEYARHCGHADLLRECIDGRTGQ